MSPDAAISWISEPLGRPRNYSSTQEDLELRAKQVAWRINSGALKSLYQKIMTEAGAFWRYLGSPKHVTST